MEEESHPPRSPPGSSSPTSALKEELRCPICLEPFRQAVTLSCGHNFCRGCVRRSWERRLRLCPLCKQSSGRAEPRVNPTLNNLVEALLREEGRRKARRVCPRHGEELRFFCPQDKELLCCSCRGTHGPHGPRPLREAAADCRAKLANMEASLRDKAEDFCSVWRSYKAISEHNKSELERLERQVQREFRALHEFLREEEEALLEQLQEEAQRKQERIREQLERLEKESQALLREARQVQQDLQEEDHEFLMTHKNRKRRIACTAEEPEAVASGLLLDVPEYLGSLQFRVWKKMLGSITAVPFSLDPRTAAGCLSVSEDLSSVSTRGFQPAVENPELFPSAPDNPERFPSAPDNPERFPSAPSVSSRGSQPVPDNPERFPSAPSVSSRGSQPILDNPERFPSAPSVSSRGSQPILDNPERFPSAPSVSSRGSQPILDNPERFSLSPCVLGSRGFSSGRHAWEVELPSCSGWRVGVARRPPEGSPWGSQHDSRSGFWFLSRAPGQAECRASDGAAGAAAGAPRRLRVELDCDEGELSFYDAERRRHLYTFHRRFAAPLFPYFCLGGPRGGGGALRVCPLHVSVREDIQE